MKKKILKIILRIVLIVILVAGIGLTYLVGLNWKTDFQFAKVNPCS